MRKVKIVLLSMLTAVLMMSTSITALAAGRENTPSGQNNVQEYLDKYGINALGEHAHPTIGFNGDSTQWDDYTLKSGTTVYLDNEAFDLIDADIAARAAQQEAASQAQQQAISQLQNVNNELNLQPDIGGAMGSLNGFIPAINFVLGLLVSLISAGMTVLTACDICYIVLPVFRGKCETMKQNGTGTSSSRSEKAGATRLVFISDEAEYSINAAETVQTGKNPLIIYFKKRAVAIIVLAVVIFVLLTGNINLVTNIAIKGVSGILNIIQNIAN